MDKFLVIVYVYPNNELENVSFFEVNKKLQCAWRERERERSGYLFPLFKQGEENKYVFFAFLFLYFKI